MRDRIFIGKFCKAIFLIIAIPLMVWFAIGCGFDIYRLFIVGTDLEGCWINHRSNYRFGSWENLHLYETACSMTNAETIKIADKYHKRTGIDFCTEPKVSADGQLINIECNGQIVIDKCYGDIVRYNRNERSVKEYDKSSPMSNMNSRNTARNYLSELKLTRRYKLKDLVLKDNKWRASFELFGKAESHNDNGIELEFMNNTGELTYYYRKYSQCPDKPVIGRDAVLNTAWEKLKKRIPRKMRHAGNVRDMYYAYAEPYYNIQEGQRCRLVWVVYMIFTGGIKERGYSPLEKFDVDRFKAHGEAYEEYKLLAKEWDWPPELYLNIDALTGEVLYLKKINTDPYWW